MGLAMGVVVTDDQEAKLPIPKSYGVDEFPVILQDRTYVDVTTQKVRLLFLGGSNRREWRLHFDDDIVMTQIARS